MQKELLRTSRVIEPTQTTAQTRRMGLLASPPGQLKMAIHTLVRLPAAKMLSGFLDGAESGNGSPLVNLRYHAKILAKKFGGCGGWRVYS